MLKTVSSIVNALGALNYKGTWNADTNTPTLASGVGVQGDYYVVSVSGSTDLDGTTNWGVGDWAAFNGSIWERLEGGADGNFVNLSVSNEATFPDNAKAIFGDGSDLQIYSDGTDSYITEGTAGNFLIQGATIKLQTGNGAKDYLVASPSAEVTLYYDNAAKLATTSTGIDVTGDIVLGDNNPTITLNDGSVTNLQHLITSSSDRLIIAADNNNVSAGSKIEFYVDGTKYSEVTPTGIDVTGSVTAEIASAGARSTLATFTNTASLAAGAQATIQLKNGGQSAFITGESTAANAGMDLLFSSNNSSSTEIARMRLAENGDISFYEDTGTTAKFFWDASAESLGIGTSSPSRQVTIQSSGAQISLLSDTTGSSVINMGDTADDNIGRIQYDNADDSMTFRTNTSDAVTIDSSGNVGIGTDSPGQKLEIKESSTGAGDAIIRLRGNGNNADNTSLGSLEWFNADSSGAQPGVVAAVEAQSANANGHMGKLLFKTHDGSGSEADPPTTRMIINQSGQVGIGTDSPATLLHVAGGSSGTDQALFRASSGGGGGLQIVCSDLSVANPTWQLNTFFGEQLAFGDGTSEHGRWDASGNFGIGTSSPVAKLHIENGDMRIEKDTKATIGFRGHTTGSTALAFRDSNAAVDRMTIDANGSVGIGTDSPDDILHLSSTLGTTLRIESTATSMVAGNNIGKIEFEGQDAEGAGVASAIRAEVLGSLGQTGLAFDTGSGGASAQRMLLDQNGNLLVGKTATGAATAGIELNGSNDLLRIARDGGVLQELNRITSDGDLIDFRKDNVSVGSIGVVNTNNLRIGGVVADHAGLQFGTNILIPETAGTASDGLVDIGTGANRYQDVYATNGTIQTSDGNEKQDIEALSDAEQRVAVAAKGLLRKFRWKSAVEAKGDEARTHFGIIAQDLQAAFAAEGLDAGDYGMFINSTWTDEETGEERSRMGVRYSELLAFIISAI